VRFVLFWTVVALAMLLVGPVAPYSNWALIARVLGEISRSDLNQIINKDFAFGLASAIGQIAVALAAAFAVCHVLLVRLALRAARKAFRKARDKESFARDFDAIADRVERNGLIGPAWREFRETTVRHDRLVDNTVRPQTFINLTEARDHLFGLKMMPAVPGFFVGLGLLLTFIGLVIALYSAASTAQAHEAKDMVNNLNQLLEAATFKFSTSIAGLGASLALSFLFRAFQIWIDDGFAQLCRVIEQLMRFHPSHRIALESREILAEQRDQLKEINSDRFFTRLGDSFGGSVETAVSSAVRPMAERLDGAMRQFEAASRGGVDEMLQNFVQKLQAGAGVELGQIAQMLDGTRRALEALQGNLSGSGVDFQRRMAEGSEALTRVMEQASQRLGGSASSAASAVEAAMAGVAEKLEEQMVGFGDSLSALQDALANQAEESARRSQEAGEAAASAARKTAEEAAGLSSSIARDALDALKTGVGDVVENLRRDIAGLSETLRVVSTIFGDQTQQIERVTARSRETADAFGQVATDVRSASEPLTKQGERISGATERMASSVSSSVAALSSVQQTATAVAEELSRHLTQIGSVWDKYEERFKNVDDHLGNAADRFRDEVLRHQEATVEFVQKVDKHTGDILAKLGQALGGLEGIVTDLDETLDHFARRLKLPEAAE
jgi:hypothetical protein